MGEKKESSRALFSICFPSLLFISGILEVCSIVCLKWLFFGPSSYLTEIIAHPAQTRYYEIKMP